MLFNLILYLENDVITDSNSFNQIITTQIIETSETKLIINNNASQVNLIKSKRKTPAKVIKRKGQSLLKTSNVPKVQKGTFCCLIFISVNF